MSPAWRAISLVAAVTPSWICLMASGSSRSRPLTVTSTMGASSRDRSGFVWAQLRDGLLGCDVQSVLRIGVRQNHRDQVLLGPARVEPALALHFLDHASPPVRGGY